MASMTRIWHRRNNRELKVLKDISEVTSEQVLPQTKRFETQQAQKVMLECSTEIKEFDHDKKNWYRVLGGLEPISSIR